MKKRVQSEDNGFNEHGGYMQVKINKLEDQFTSLKHLQKTKIFEGISIFVNGRTNPSADELKIIMLENGGIFHHYQRNGDFIIANNLPDVKIRSASMKNVVRPEWIVDSLREKRLLDYAKYLLHTKHNSAQPQISFPKITENSNQEEFKNERTGTAVDRDFLQEFLTNSRLHHISSLSSGFKFYVSDLRKRHDGNFPERETLKSKLPRTDTKLTHDSIIMHIDMDCFFVSVSLIKNPHLKGQPVAVTHSKANATVHEDSMSEIASCNYEARKMGLRNGMFVGDAMKLCPDLKTMPYDFEEYKKVAYILYDTVAKYTLNIEAVSCDELYADLKNLIDDCEVNIMDFITFLRSEIFRQTGCTCSVGIGVNRLQARLANKRAKPNGQFELLSMEVKEFMKNWPITDLPGIGRSTAYNLEKLGLSTCGQLQEISMHVLQNHFGKKFGETMVIMAHGLDNRPLVYEQIRKSVSVDINYGIRFNDDREVKRFLMQVCEELSRRLVEIGKKGKCITLKVMMRSKEASMISKKFMGHGQVEKCSKSASLVAFTNDAITIFSSTVSLLDALNIPAYELRGIGVQVSKLNEQLEQKNSGKLLQMFKKISENPEYKSKAKFEVYSSKTGKSPTKNKNRGLKRVKSNESFTSIADMFATIKTTNKRKEIDPQILSELPPDIVAEILRDFDDDLEETTPSSTAIEFSKNIFTTNDKWRTTIKTLIESQKDVDQTVSLLSTSLTQLIVSRNLELPFIVMRFLHRIISDFNSESWKVAYKHILYENLQKEMYKNFKRKLSVPYDF